MNHYFRLCVAVGLFPTAGLGSTLAQSPPLQGNIRIRYEVPFAQHAQGLRLAYKF